jgi:dipeptide/tripeptide permease
VNGIGDLFSSILIGFIWAFVGYSAGFAFAAVVAAAGTVMMGFFTLKTRVAATV